jgi:RNA polymerase-binding transcription factor DksA
MQTETSPGPLTGPAGGGASPAGATRPGPPGATRPVPAGGTRWRALLEARWRARLQEVTELALAYHEAAAATGHDTSGADEGKLRLQRLQRLLRRTVASRRALADTEEALARLSAGNYGWCESCADTIPAERLAVTPETRYCARCTQEPCPEVPAHRGSPGHGDRLAARSRRQGRAQ